MVSFAVVIPNYNQSRFLSHALESLSHQSVPRNVAIVDGGSTDGFFEAVDNYKNMVSYLRSRPDEGQAAAIAEGTQAVEGNIVCWLNADDYYFAHALDRVAEVFEKNPDMDVIYGDAVHVTPEGGFISYFPAAQEFNPRILPKSCFICQPACFVKREAYEAVGGINPALSYAMDWDLWCRLSANGARFLYIQELLAAVRYYAGTKTSSGSRARYEEIWRIGYRYGGMLIPYPWLGFYFFDLQCKKGRLTPFQKACYHVLAKLRKCKKRMVRSNSGLQHGFYRWEKGIEGRCCVMLPWYAKSHIKQLRLTVSPGAARYKAEINERKIGTLMANSSQVIIDLPDLTEPLLRVGLECLDQQQWHLLDFRFN